MLENRKSKVGASLHSIHEDKLCLTESEHDKLTEASLSNKEFE